MTNKVLLIGGEGYIGRVVSKFLTEKKINVISYDNLIYEKNKIQQKNNNKYFEYKFGDLNDLKTINNIANEVENVVILAGLVGDPITKKYKTLSKIINEDNIINFINNVASHNAFFYRTSLERGTFYTW